MDPVATLSTSFTADDFLQPAPAGLDVTEAAPTVVADPEVAEPRSTAPALKALTVYRAISEPTRLRIVELLSTGKRYSASRLAKLLQRDERRIGRHLKRLRACGLTFTERGEDRRYRHHGIRPAFLTGTRDGHRIVDFGSGVLRFPVLPADSAAG